MNFFSFVIGEKGEVYNFCIYGYDCALALREGEEREGCVIMIPPCFCAFLVFDILMF